MTPSSRETRSTRSHPACPPSCPSPSASSPCSPHPPPFPLPSSFFSFSSFPSTFSLCSSISFQPSPSFFCHTHLLIPPPPSSPLLQPSSLTRSCTRTLLASVWSGPATPAFPGTSPPPTRGFSSTSSWARGPRCPAR